MRKFDSFVAPARLALNGTARSAAYSLIFHERSSAQVVTQAARALWSLRIPHSATEGILALCLHAAHDIARSLEAL